MTLPSFLKKRENETHFEWKIRMLMAKLDKETDLDWIEIRDFLGEDCSSDHLRKTAYGIREYDNYIKEKKFNEVEDSTVLDELESKKIEIQAERNKLQSIRLDHNKAIREQARKELIVEHVKDSFEKLPVPEVKIKPSNFKQNTRKAVLAFGDAHWGKVSESYWNSYSPEIFEKRMEKLAEETIMYLRKEGIEELDILSLADSIEGMSLRISQLQTLRTGFIDQTIAFAKYMSSWLNELSKYFTKITYHHTVSSNHSEIRPFNTKRGEFPAEDLEKIIVNYLHDVLIDNDRIEIPIYKDIVTDFKTNEFEHAVTHGHAFKNSKNLLKDISHHRRKFYDYLWIAHYHHSDVVTVGQTETHNLEVIKVPSIMGSDDYSDSLLTGAKAGAVINIFEDGKGRVDQHNIILN